MESFFTAKRLPMRIFCFGDELFTYKIPIFAIDNVVSCYYNAGDGTASRVQDKEIKNKNWLNYQKLKHQLSSINV